MIITVNIKSVIRKGLRLFNYEIDKIQNDYLDVINLVKPYTMTGPYSILSLIYSVNYLIKNKISGDIVECGVWKGGSMMAVLKTLQDLKNYDKEIYLFDTFSGMPKPTDQDVKVGSTVKASTKFNKEKIGKDSSNWVNASIYDVKENIAKIGYDKNKIHFVEGKVEETIPYYAPSKIALLRLDTDWYKSTLHELIHLFPLLVKGGIIIIDDYDDWGGARKAVDQYLYENEIPLFLNKILGGGRIGVKI